MNKKLALTMVSTGIVINIIGGLVATTLKIPIFLDSIGTMLAAVTLGPWLGALTGLLSNVFQGLATDPVSIPFAVIGLVVGFLAKKRGFTDYITPLLAGIILAFVAPIIGTPIAVYLFGGGYWRRSGHTLFNFIEIRKRNFRQCLSGACTC